MTIFTIKERIMMRVLTTQFTLIVVGNGLHAKKQWAGPGSEQADST